MTWVKICGMTNLEDALTAAEAGADAVGFVFYEKSPRNISVEAAREIVEKLPESVEKVGVFVGGTGDDIKKAAQSAGLTAVQFYPRDAVEAPSGWENWKEKGKYKLILAVQGEKLMDRKGPDGSGVSFLPMGSARKNGLHAFLIDSGAGGRPGGTGEAFDWERCHLLVRGLNVIAPIIVAGGLTIANVGKAIDLFDPFGVDVVSGVEATPGKKDPEKVRAFVKAVRVAEAGGG